MNVREIVVRSAVSGSVAAAAFLAVNGLAKKLMAEAKVGQRVTSTGDSFLVAVRGPGDWHDVREFIQPYDPQVQALYQSIGPDPWGCYRYVCENISYARERHEFWRWPAETLAERLADCEDTSFVLASLLRNFTEAFVVVGKYRGYGHAWVQTASQIMETTLVEPIVVDDPENYDVFFYFNDQVAVELWPGALEEIISTKSSELAKLKLIGGA